MRWSMGNRWPIRGAAASTLFLLGAALSLCLGAAPWRSDTDAGLVGTWQLRSVIDPPGTTQPWMGRKPQGVLTYTPDGWVVVQIRRDPPASMQGTPRDSVPCVEALDALRGYYAYWGRYEIDADAKVIQQHVEGSLIPGEVGVTYVRPYEIIADTLIYRASTRNGWRTSVWVRAPHT